MSNEKVRSGVNMHIKDDRTSMLFFLFIAFLYSVVAMTKNCFSSALAAIVSEGIMTKSQTGLITSAFYVVYAPLQIVGGILSDKYNPERLVKIGLAGAVIANLVIFFNHNYYIMLGAWILNGIAQMGLWPGIFKIVSSQLSPDWQRKGIYYISFTTTLGLVLGYVAAAFVTKWEYNFLLSAVLLILLIVMLDIIYKRVEKHMEPDTRPLPEKGEEKIEKVSTLKLFVKSGFLILLPVYLLRYMLDNAIKTLTPTMLFESYSNVSVSIGNLLNILILISGILGIILIRKFVFPRRLRNEVSTILMLFLLALPFVIIIKFTGVLNVWIIIAAMCMISILLSGSYMVITFVTGAFSKYGKNATAAGVANTGSSLGVVVQSYGFAYIADHSGWGAVTTVYIVSVLVTVGFLACALPLWTKFKNK